MGEMRERNKQQIKDKVGGFTVVRSFTMLYAGWECDSDAWIIKTGDGSLQLVLTNHGSAYIADESELREQIETNLDIVEEQQRALTLLTGHASGSAST